MKKIQITKEMIEKQILILQAIKHKVDNHLNISISQILKDANVSGSYITAYIKLNYITRINGRRNKYTFNLSEIQPIHARNAIKLHRKYHKDKKNESVKRLTGVENIRVYDKAAPTNATRKSCVKCKESKPLNKFGKHRRSADGLQSWCKTCQSESNRKRIAAQREAVDIVNTMKSRNNDVGIIRKFFRWLW